MQKIKELFRNKTVRMFLIAAAALLILIAVYKVFFSAKKAKSQTETEARIEALLERVEGVKDVTVVITERDGKAVGAVVVFGGEDGILIRHRVTEVAARALDLPDRAIAVYPAK